MVSSKNLQGNRMQFISLNFIIHLKHVLSRREVKRCSRYSRRKIFRLFSTLRETVREKVLRGDLLRFSPWYLINVGDGGVLLNRPCLHLPTESILSQPLLRKDPSALERLWF